MLKFQLVNFSASLLADIPLPPITGARTKKIVECCILGLFWSIQSFFLDVSLLASLCFLDEEDICNCYKLLLSVKIEKGSAAD